MTTKHRPASMTLVTLFIGLCPVAWLGETAVAPSRSSRPTPALAAIVSTDPTSGSMLALAVIDRIEGTASEGKGGMGPVRIHPTSGPMNE